VVDIVVFSTDVSFSQDVVFVAGRVCAKISSTVAFAQFPQSVVDIAFDVGGADDVVDAIVVAVTVDVVLDVVVVIVAIVDSVVALVVDVVVIVDGVVGVLVIIVIV